MTEDQEHQRWIRKALELAHKGIERGGGPFGAVVVKDGRLLASAHNQVALRHDPTAHAEVLAIREACVLLGTFRLDGCAMYASCEPCPMCLGALYWARVRGIYYANTRVDAAAAGFDDSLIYQELARAPADRRLKQARLELPGRLTPLTIWQAKEDKTPY